MKSGKYVLTVLFLLLFIPLAFSQDAVMVLDHKELGPHERPLVSFAHEAHMENIDCIQCHHDYDEYLNNRGGDGVPCAECHGAPSRKNLPDLTQAFHGQCKGCHERMLVRGKSSVPVMCGECHVKN